MTFSRLTTRTRHNQPGCRGREFDVHEGFAPLGAERTPRHRDRDACQRTGRHASESAELGLLNRYSQQQLRQLAFHDGRLRDRANAKQGGPHRFIDRDADGRAADAAFAAAQLVLPEHEPVDRQRRHLLRRFRWAALPGRNGQVTWSGRSRSPATAGVAPLTRPTGWTPRGAGVPVTLWSRSRAIGRVPGGGGIRRPLQSRHREPARPRPVRDDLRPRGQGSWPRSLSGGRNAITDDGE